MTGTTHTNVGDYTSDAWSFTSTDGNYTASGTVHDIITVATPVITVTCTDSVYTGSAIDGCTAVENGPGIPKDTVVPVTSYSNNVNVGTATGTATVAATGNYGAATGSNTFQITPATATCGSIAGYDVTYDGNSHTAGGACLGVDGKALDGLVLSGTNHTPAGAYPGDPWTFTDISGNYKNASGTVDDHIAKAKLTITALGQSKAYGVGYTLNQTRYTISGLAGTDTATVTLTAPASPSGLGATDQVGSYPIHPTATGSGLDNYAITYVNGTLTVGKINQKITFPNPGNQLVGTPAFALTATSDSGLPVSYTVVLGPCTVSGKMLTVGSASAIPCTIRADQAGDTNYNAAPSQYVAFLVVKSPQTITFNPPASVVYGTAPFKLTATSTSGLTVTLTALGSCSLDSSNNLTVGNVGTCLVTATQGGDDNYYFAAPVLRTIQITRAPLTITALPQSHTYGTLYTLATGASHYSVTGLVAGTTDSVANVQLTANGTPSGLGASDAVGTYPIHPHNATGTGLGNYTITYTNGVLTVTGIPSSVTVSCSDVVYNGSAQTPCTAKVDVLGTVVPVAYLGDDTNVGTVNVTAAWGGDKTHAPSTGTGSFKITPAPLTITADPQTKVYGTAADLGTTKFAITGTVFTGDTITNVVLASTGAAADATVSGPTYPIVASAASGTGAGNYDITYKDGALTVTAAELTITAKDQSKAFADPLTLDGTADFTHSTLYNGDKITSVTLTCDGLAAFSPVGAHDIVPSDAIGSGLDNYTIKYDKGTLTIDNKPDLTITANDRTKVYGTTLTLGTSSGGFSSAAVGFDDQGVKIAGLLAGDHITTVDLASVGAAATATVADSTYAIVASNVQGIDINHYHITYNPGKLTVTKADLSVTATDQTKTVGTAIDLGTSNFSAPGLLNGDTIASVALASGGADAGAALGDYDITAGGATGTGLDNYTITYHKGTLHVIEQRVLTVKANNITRNYKKANPTLTYTITGYDPGDDESVVTTKPHCTTTATISSVPGTYQITCAGAESDSGKYTFNYVSGTLTVKGSVVGGETAPVTATTHDSPLNGDSTPLFALLISLAFGGLGLLAVAAQRKATRA